eukprot:gene20293-27050_t
MLQKEIETSRPDRPIYLLGESFGALLALALANQMPDIDRVILVNPATGFAKSAWPRIGPLLTSLPETLYNTLPIALSPLIGNPIAMAMHGVRANQNLPNQASDFAYSLLDLIPELSMLRLVLPPATLSWRLRLLAQGAESANKNLNKVKQRCLLLVGELDLIVPNKDESKRLMKTLPRCQLRSLPRRTHAMLQESGVELMTILHEEGFYVPVRRMSNKRKTVEPSPPPPMSKKDNDDDDSSTGGPSSGPDSPPSSMAETVEDLSGAVDEAAKAASKAVDELAATASDAAEIATGDISAAFAGSTLEAVAHAHVEEHLHNSKDAVKEKRKPSGSNFGTAGPLEKPTRRETEIASESANLKLLRTLTEIASESANLKLLRTLVSPIYLTTGEDGVTRKGLEGLPLDGRPVLFVGNHQLFAPDLPLMIEDFLTQKDTLLRGLTHPFALVTNENGEGAPFGRFLETYGATPVNGPNMYKLLSQSEAVLLYPGCAREAIQPKGEKHSITITVPNISPSLSPAPSLSLLPPRSRLLSQSEAVLLYPGYARCYPRVKPCYSTLAVRSEAVLLYPGGAREAMKLKGEKYTIMWPETQEFVRMAARFNAIIVPFAAVGAEDGFNQVFDSKEMMELPIVGDYLKSQVPKDIPMARKGVNAGKIEEENWVMPFVTFNQPARFYYKFQKPVETDQSMLKDKDAAQAAYMGIKAQVEGGLAYLLEKREEDPYKDLAARLLYEATRGEQAPTFEI